MQIHIVAQSNCHRTPLFGLVSYALELRFADLRHAGAHLDSHRSYPGLLGVSNGASIVMAAIVIFHLPVPWPLYPVVALAGGMIAGSVSLLSMRRLGDPVRLILMGVAVGSLLNAGIIAIISLGQEGDVGLLYLFLLGSLANRTWDYVNLVWPWAAICIPSLS